MYLEHFNLRDHPFRLTPDAEFLYLSEQHGRAKAAMEQAWARRDALVVVTGDVGCGKTTLVNRVLAGMPDDAAVARLTLTNLDSQEFLQSVLSQYGFEPFERSRDRLMGLLDNFLFAQNVRERPVVLIIEEAQNLSKAVLDIVLDLVDVDADSEKLISVILVGQPSLTERLRDRELKLLAKRVTCSAHLEPLDQKSTIRMIRHRLEEAGCPESPFDDAVYPLIYSHTGGVPRLIVNLCDTAMTAAYVEDSLRITPEILATAIEELKLEHVAEADPDLVDIDEQADDTAGVRLSLYERGQPAGEIALEDTRVMIGRDSDNDITIVSEYISRHHAQVVMDHDSRYWVKDLNSTNGVYVNRHKIQRCMLNDGDRIALGYHELVFHDRNSRVEAHEPAELSEWRDTTVLDQPVEDDQADSA